MKVVLAAGGTAGHINPALAIADKIKQLFPDALIKFVGAQGGMEERLVRSAGYDFTAFKMAGFQRKLTPNNIKRNIQAVHYYITAKGYAHDLLREFAPDVVIGTGGYVCAPVLTAASKMGIKTAVHESNSLPGITTTMLSKHVDKVLVSNEDVLSHLSRKDNCVITGNPLRSNIPIEERSAARARLGLPDGMTIVSFGGSLGANKISRAVVAMLGWEHECGDINHIHAFGGNGKDMFDGLLKEYNITPGERFRAQEYIDNMYTCLCAADLVISRSGAMTLTELKATGRPAILIPFPQAAENHQYYNALTMSKNGAAILIEDKELTPERLLGEVKALYSDRARLAAMGDNAAKLNIPNSTDLVVSNILDLVK